jgi:hypothetical protein
MKKTLSDFKARSVVGLRGFINEQVHMSRQMVMFIRKIVKVMSSSRGRDKICGIVQYLCKMVALSAMDSNIPYIRNSFERMELPYHFIAYKIWKSLSQARKIFRFLKFIEVIEEIIQVGSKLQDKASLTRVLELLSKVSSFFYFILDNFVWFINTNILRWA